MIYNIQKKLNKPCVSYPLTKSLNHARYRCTGGFPTPQYSSSFAICSWLILPRAVCPTLAFNGSMGEAVISANAAILTANRSSSIFIKFLKINFPVVLFKIFLRYLFDLFSYELFHMNCSHIRYSPYELFLYNLFPCPLIYIIHN